MRSLAQAALKPVSEEHFPWHYTEFGVICACGESMRDEVCPSDCDMTTHPTPPEGTT